MAPTVVAIAGRCGVAGFGARRWFQTAVRDSRWLIMEGFELNARAQLGIEQLRYAIAETTAATARQI